MRLSTGETLCLLPRASLALQHKKGQGVFPSAALKDCSVCLNSRLSCFLLLFSVSGSLVVAVDGRHTSSSSAGVARAAT